MLRSRLDALESRASAGDAREAQSALEKEDMKTHLRSVVAKIEGVIEEVKSLREALGVFLGDLSDLAKKTTDLKYYWLPTWNWAWRSWGLAQGAASASGQALGWGDATYDDEEAVMEDGGNNPAPDNI